MKSSMHFVATVVGIVLAGSAAAFLLPDGTARRAVLGAGILALGTQIPAHFLLRGWRRRNDRFIAAIGLGFAQRVVVLVTGIVLFALPGRADPLPFLMSLGTFLVAIAIVESCFEHVRVRNRAATLES